MPHMIARVNLDRARKGGVFEVTKDEVEFFVKNRFAREATKDEVAEYKAAAKASKDE